MADRITAKATAIPCRPSMWPLLADKPPTGNTSLKIWVHAACVNPKLKVQDISRKNKLCPGEIVYFILVRRTSPRNSRKESDFMRQLGVEVLKIRSGTVLYSFIRLLAAKIYIREVQH
jgi:hypothetical protein